MPKHNQNKIVIGITGSFGSGKSTVAEMFASLGAKVINADKIAHRIILSGDNAYRRICKIFGKRILKKNKQIDRNKLADIVFDDKRLLRKLNQIIHPQVTKIIKKKIDSIKKGMVVLDVPLLIESGLNKNVDKLIVVKANRLLQIERLQAKTRLNKSEILKRLKAQMPISKKADLADFIIDNSGSLDKTKKQVERIYKKGLSLVANI